MFHLLIQMQDYFVTLLRMISGDCYREQHSLVLCAMTPPSAGPVPSPPVARKNAAVSAGPGCMTPPLALLQANLSRPCSTFAR